MARGQQAPNNQAPPNPPNLIGRAHLEDTGSHLYLQNGDHPGMKLVSHLLTGNNYNSWNRSMTTALTAKNKFVFVYGSLLKPNSNDLLFGAWIRCNSMVISWILNVVSRGIADSLLYMSTASEIWGDLRNRFHESNAPRIFQIKKLLNGLQQGSMDANSYYTKLRIMWDELKDFQAVSMCNCGSMKEWMNYQD
ncbi:uncharacterized protein [Henckelia pumila]|uniref:uncharacterized protein n=1 Tax=Henckelia pumila TaxID=405737 RepID=UPI003C6E7479